jgi:hypothetical protein
VDVKVQDGWYLVTIPKGVLVFSRAQFIEALRRGKAFKRREALAVCMVQAPPRRKIRVPQR